MYNGFISTVSPEGKVLKLKWIDGASENVTLHAPKGLAIYGDRLFVADIDTVRIFDRMTGTPLNEIIIEGTTFLNDIVVTIDGTLYVSESAIKFNNGTFIGTNQDAIYRISTDGIVTEFSKGSHLAQPNGLEVIEKNLGVVTRGAADFYILDNNGKKQHSITLPGTILDGLVQVENGAFWVSSWQTSSLYRLDKNSSVTHTIKLPVPAANISYDKNRQHLLLPLLKSNQIAFLPIK